MIAILRHTFRALLREKIVFNVFGVTILLLFFGYLASQLVYGHQDRVMLDMGLMMNAFSIFAVAIGVGSRFLRQEIENKNIYLYLTRPISRTSFLMGRMAGIALFILFNFSILVVVLAGAVAFVGGKVSLAYVQSALLTWMESLILFTASLTLSFWLRPALTAMVMLAMVFLGHNHGMLNSLQSGISKINYLTPNLEAFLMSSRVTYGEALTNTEMAQSFLYGGAWLFFFTLIGNAVFSKRNL